MSHQVVMMISRLQILSLLGVQTWQKCTQFLWSRVSDRKLSNPDKVKIVNIQTYTHRTCDIGDINIIFSPNTDLALWNYIAREIVYRDKKGGGTEDIIDWEFVDKNLVFTAGPVNIGYGMRRAGEKSIKDGKYTALEMETIDKEMKTTVSAKEGPSLEPYGYKEGDDNETHSRYP